ncbi:phosphomannomutase CpsG [Thalassotalea fonticola]|uniref:phosphomannomutase n=1 Tax=Thalassotalea fonticola TaxID=3065649 RepID=A0ABZ0GVM9_9GAMM|nr:phosphomannomutase CpsG [Colwelliaceae bacterium S1-1]
MELTCFKAYDIRGKLGEELNEDIAYAIGRAFALVIKPKSVVVGGDIRLTSHALKQAIAHGLMAEGVDVVDIGMTGTEEIYFATKFLRLDGGIEVTASHNPLDYNGMKLVRDGSKPISGDSGLFEIKKKAEQILAGKLGTGAKWIPEQAGNDGIERGGLDKGGVDKGDLGCDGLGRGDLGYDVFGNSRYAVEPAPRGNYQQRDLKADYAKHMLEFIKPEKLKPLRLVVNSGNGAAGPALDAIEHCLQTCGVNIEFIKVHHQANGSFPNGIPNPLLPECRADTSNAVLKHHADMGIAWDGDFDRCFLFDEQGNFIEGYYIVGLLAEAFLKQESGDPETSSASGGEPDGDNSRSLPELVSGSLHSKEKIIHDPRLTYNTIDIVNCSGGKAIMSKTGHAFIKERMREENAIYGGEMSAHHYFRDFAYCDSGMIPWLLVAELLSVSGKPLSSLVKERIALFPSSGEINSTLDDPKYSIEKVRSAFETDAVSVHETDGISLEFKGGEGEWRFNLRSSNTEPVVRLNVESKGNVELMQRKTKQILDILHN